MRSFGNSFRGELSISKGSLDGSREMPMCNQNKSDQHFMLSTLKVESFAGRNFRDFACFSVVRES